MREIKFRAWDKDTRRMYNPQYVTKIKEWQKEPNVLMQYTGLKDKNGKEIYEGDIVNSINFAHDRAVNEVIYNQKEGAFTLKSGFLFARYENEIIGNIYENPNLLK